MPEIKKCPRCGAEKQKTDTCKKCRVNIPKYLELQKRRKAVPQAGPAPGKQAVPAPEAPQSATPPPQKPQSAEPPKQVEPEPAVPEGAASPGSSISEPRPARSLKMEAFSVLMQRTTLSSFGHLFRYSFGIYKSRFPTFISLMLFQVLGIGILLGFVFLNMPASQPQVKDIPTGMIIGALAIVALFILLLLWGFSAMIFAASDETIGAVEALKRGIRRLCPLLWVLSLVGFIATGGVLLFIIPGILFFIWFGLAQFVLAKEDERGMNAILKSMAYVKGYSWEVFTRLFLLGLITGLLGVIPFAGPVISFFLIPLGLIFNYQIYDELREIKGKELQFAPTRGEKCKWMGIGAIGYVVAPLIALVLAAVIGLSILGIIASGLSMPGAIKITPHEEMMPDEIMKEAPPQPQETPSQQIPPGQMPAQPAPVQPQQPAFNLISIEGIWNGREVNGLSDWVFIIKGRAIEVYSPNAMERHKGTIVEAVPNSKFDIRITDSPSPEHLLKTVPGIFKLAGSTFTVCRGTPGDPNRPTGFLPSGKFRCFELERQAGR